MTPSPLRRWWPVAVVYAVILALSSVPGDSLAGTPGWTAVGGHATGYALLAFAAHRAAGGRSAGLFAIALALVLGLANELQQGLVPGRSPDIADVGVDGLGALAGVLVRGALVRRRRGHPGSRRLSRPSRGSRPPARASAAQR